MSKVGTVGGKIIDAGLHSASITNGLFIDNDADARKVMSVIDTSNLHSTVQMFVTGRSVNSDTESNLTTAPLFDTSNVTVMDEMFCGCHNLTSIPMYNTEQVISMDHMFGSCTSLREIPCFNTRKVEVMVNMFNGCTNLVSVPALDMTSVTDADGMFAECWSLSSILVTNVRTRLDIHETNMGHDSVVILLNNLGTPYRSSINAIFIKPDVLDSLTSYERSIATSKGWVLCAEA